MTKEYKLVEHDRQELERWLNFYTKDNWLLKVAWPTSWVVVCILERDKPK